MNAELSPWSPQINLIAAWIGILLGFLSGMVLGLFFHRENWLGGYASLPRRLYRLAHISFFGLGAVNLLFFFTARTLALSGPLAEVASWAFLVGAVSMPVCCVVMAHFPRTQPIFGVPVLSLIAGGALTLLALVRTPDMRTNVFTAAKPVATTLNHQPISHSP